MLSLPNRGEFRSPDKVRGTGCFPGSPRRPASGQKYHKRTDSERRLRCVSEVQKISAGLVGPVPATRRQANGD